MEDAVVMSPSLKLRRNGWQQVGETANGHLADGDASGTGFSRRVDCQSTAVSCGSSRPSNVVSAGMKQINHFINGVSVAATSDRTSPVFNPATGEKTADLGLASVEDVEAAVAAATRGIRYVASDEHRGPDQAHVPVSEPGGRKHGRDRTRAHGRAWQGPERRGRGGRARSGEHRVRLRDRRTVEGFLQRGCIERRQRLHDTATTRCRCRNHAV